MKRLHCMTAFSSIYFRCFRQARRRAQDKEEEHKVSDSRVAARCFTRRKCIASYHPRSLIEALRRASPGGKQRRIVNWINRSSVSTLATANVSSSIFDRIIDETRVRDSAPHSQVMHRIRGWTAGAQRAKGGNKLAEFNSSMEP